MGLCDDDGSLGPASGCRDTDFTLAFGDLLSAIACALSLVALTWRTASLVRSSPTCAIARWARCRGLVLLAVKAIAGLALISTALACCALWPDNGSVAIVSLALTAASVVIGTVLILLEHFYMLKASAFASLWLLSTIAVDIVRVRSVFTSWAPTDAAPAAIFAAQFGFRCLLLVADNVSKPSLVGQAELDGLSLESCAPFLDRTLIAWLNPMLWRGWRRNSLKMADLPSLARDQRPAELWAALEPYWDPHVRGPLIRTLWRGLRSSLTEPIPTGLLSGALPGIQPLLIFALVDFLASYADGRIRQSSTWGWLLASGLLLVSSLYAIVTARNQALAQESAGRVRGALIQAIYLKVLRAHGRVAAEEGQGVATTLVSVDVERIVESIVIVLNQLAPILSLIGVSLWILWLVGGVAVLISSTIVVLAGLAFTPFLGAGITVKAKRWNQLRDARVKGDTSIVHNLLAIKYAAIEAPVEKRAAEMRRTELAARTRASIATMTVCIWANWIGEVLSIVGLVTYWIETRRAGRSLDPATVFTIVAVGTSISWPISSVAQRFSQLQTAWASLSHLESFLCAEEKTAETSDEKHVDEKAARAARLRSASVGYGDKVILRDIEYEPEPASLTIVLGEVGSGKSTLLLALLGELDQTAGSAQLSSEPTAYAGQDAWLIASQSLRRNICFNSVFDPERYATTLEACCLVEDCAGWPDGDERLCEGLSGGQRQRVALARAVYADQADLTLLDDPLSAVDATVEAQIWRSLFAASTGLLRTRRVVLVTSAVHHITDADQVIYLESGRITQRGRPDELLAIDGSVRRLFEAFQRRSVEVVTDPLPSKSPAAKRSGASTPVDGDEIDKEAARASVPGNASWETFKASCVMTIVRADGDSNRALNLFAWTLGALGENTPTFVASFLAYWLAQPDLNHPRYLGAVVAINAFWFVGIGAGLFVSIVWASTPMFQKFHQRALGTLLRSSRKEQTSHSTGTLVARLGQDLTHLDERWPGRQINVANRTGGLIGRTVLIGVASPPILGVVALTIFVIERVQRFYLATSRPLRKLVASSKSGLYSHFAETIDVNGLRTIRAFKAEPALTRRYAELAATSQGPWLLNLQIQAWWALCATLLSGATAFAIATVSVGTREKTSSTIAGAALTVALSLGSVVTHFVRNVVELQLAATAVQRVRALFFLKPEEVLDPRVDTASLRGQLDGGIEFDRVTFTYRPDHPPAVDELSLSIRPHERLGICGRSGSGKSTLLWLLFAMAEPQSGSIRIDGRPLDSIAKHSVRDAMSIIPQEPALIETSLRENLDPFGEHADDAIWAALDEIQASSVVRRLPDGLDTAITGGATGQFSRGERQLLALATCVLRGRAIVALDESTASVDLATERAIQTALATGFKDATVIIVAHRISTIMGCDRVCVMSAGRIVEIGPPQELLARPGSHFAALAGSLAVDRAD